MFVVGIAATALFMSVVRHARNVHRGRVASTPASKRRKPQQAASILVVTALAAVLMVPAGIASAAIVPTVPLGTAGEYVVLGASTVTNTGPSVLNGNLGLTGTSVTGFPPGLVNGTTHIANAEASLAQDHLTTAFNNAAGRSLDQTTTAELGDMILVGGVYAGPGKSPLGITGQLVLDGENNLDSVFIFQTDSTLTTASSSSVLLINGAQACNVFWLVGSSATIGSDSDFAGTILAQDSITVVTGATVQGRALARTGAVTLDNNVFTLDDECLTQTSDTTTTTIADSDTTSTVDDGSTSTTAPGSLTTTAGGGSTIVVAVTGGGDLPLTGGAPDGILLMAALAALIVGVVAVRGGRSTER